MQKRRKIKIIRSSKSQKFISRAGIYERSQERSTLCYMNGFNRRVSNIFKTMESSILLNFLKQTKEQCMNDIKLKYTHVILGNEACDMDSAICAIAMGYYYSQVNGSDEVKCVAPVLNIHSHDYALRTEITHVLKKINIGKADLIFKNDINLKVLNQSKKLSMTLVDHNILTGENTSLENSVTEVIDHHKFDRSLKDGENITVEMVGSCSTLVAEKLLKDHSFKLPTELAILLRSTIILDTVCLSEQADRKTQKDVDMVIKLEEFLSESPTSREKLFKELQDAKMDVSGLNNMEILRKDLKIIRGDLASLAMSSIPIKLKDFDQRSSTLPADLQDFTSSHEVEGVVVMTLTFTDTGEAQREIALFCPEHSLREKITEVLCKCTEPNLGLSLLANCFDNVTAMVSFTQSNITASRKKVLPLLQDFIRR